MDKPIRCFEGNAKPHEPFWRWVANTNIEGESEPELELYGYISEYSWFEDDITPKMFKDDLYKNGKGGPITIRINSGGGEMFAASMIKSYILDYPGHVTVKIDGLAASAATLVALAGDTVKAVDTAFMMIHDPGIGFVWAFLKIDDMTRYLEQLKTTKAALIDVYETRTGISRDRLNKMMSAETWMTASEAKALGFIDEVVTVKENKTAANNRTITNAVFLNALDNYVNVPEALRNRLAAHPEINQPPAEYGEEVALTPEQKKLRAEAKILMRIGE